MMSIAMASEPVTAYCFSDGRDLNGCDGESDVSQTTILFDKIHSAGEPIFPCLSS